MYYNLILADLATIPLSGHAHLAEPGCLCALSRQYEAGAVYIKAGLWTGLWTDICG